MNYKKIFLTLTLLSVWASFLFAQPANDLCSNAIDVTIASGNNLKTVQTIDNATTTDAPVNCGVGINNSDYGGVWFTFTTTTDISIYELKTCASDFDTEISLFTGSCGNLTCYDGNDDGYQCKLKDNRAVYFLKHDGTIKQYYVYVKGNTSNIGNLGFTIVDRSERTPSYDICGNALTIATPKDGETKGIDGNVQWATTNGAPDDCGTNINNSDNGGIWYKFSTGTGTTLYEFSTCNIKAQFDTEISVFSGTCGNLTCIGGNDDNASCATGSGSVLSTYSMITNHSQVTDYYIYVKSNDNSYGDVRLTVTNQTSILPVEMTYFKGKQKENYNLLEWQTASETNTAWHVVERSLDGKNWKEIDRITASGHSVTLQSYEYKDYYTSNAYYRIRSIDFDETYMFSTIVYIERENTSINVDDFVVYPSPTTHQVNIQFEAKHEETLYLEIINVYGQVIYRDFINTELGNNNFAIDVSHFVKGIYFIQFSTKSGKKITKRIVKN